MVEVALTKQKLFTVVGTSTKLNTQTGRDQTDKVSINNSQQSLVYTWRVNDSESNRRPASVYTLCIVEGESIGRVRAVVSRRRCRCPARFPQHPRPKPLIGRRRRLVDARVAMETRRHR